MILFVSLFDFCFCQSSLNNETVFPLDGPKNHCFLIIKNDIYVINLVKAFRNMHLQIFSTEDAYCEKPLLNCF